MKPNEGEPVPPPTHFSFVWPIIRGQECVELMVAYEEIYDADGWQLTTTFLGGLQPDHPELTREVNGVMLQRPEFPAEAQSLGGTFVFHDKPYIVAECKWWMSSKERNGYRIYTAYDPMHPKAAKIMKLMSAQGKHE